MRHDATTDWATRDEATSEAATCDAAASVLQDPAADVAEKPRAKRTPQSRLANVLLGEKSPVSDVIFAPIAAAHAVRAKLIHTLESFLQSAQPGADAPPQTRKENEDELRALMLEAAVKRYGPSGATSASRKRGSRSGSPRSGTRCGWSRARGRGNHRSGVLEVHPAILERLTQESAVLADRFPRHMPMLVPPRPWVR